MFFSIFFQLERAADGFSVVAEYYGRGVFNKVCFPLLINVEPTFLTPPLPPPLVFFPHATDLSPPPSGNNRPLEIKVKRHCCFRVIFIGDACD